MFNHKKKISIFLIITMTIFVLSACGNKEKEPEVNEIEKKYMAKLEAYFEKLPAEKVGELGSEEEQTEILNQMIEFYEQRVTSEEINSLYLDGIIKMSPENADELVRYAIAGIRQNAFADTKPIDFTEFAKHRLYNTKPMESLLVSLAIDEIEPIVLDAALAIDLDTLAARTYYIGKMLDENGYQQTRYEKYLATRFLDHMNMLFFGVLDTPTFSNDTGIVNSETIEMLREIESIPDNFMADLVKEWLEVLDGSDLIIDDFTRSWANDTLGKINAKYNIDSESMKEYWKWMTGIIKE